MPLRMMPSRITPFDKNKRDCEYKNWTSYDGLGSIQNEKRHRFEWIPIPRKTFATESIRNENEMHTTDWRLFGKTSI